MCYDGIRLISESPERIGKIMQKTYAAYGKADTKWRESQVSCKSHAKFENHDMKTRCVNGIASITRAQLIKLSKLHSVNKAANDASYAILVKN